MNSFHFNSTVISESNLRQNFLSVVTMADLINCLDDDSLLLIFDQFDCPKDFLPLAQGKPIRLLPLSIPNRYSKSIKSFHPCPSSLKCADAGITWWPAFVVIWPLCAYTFRRVSTRWTAWRPNVPTFVASTWFFRWTASVQMDWIVCPCFVLSSKKSMCRDSLFRAPLWLARDFVFLDWKNWSSATCATLRRNIWRSSVPYTQNWRTLNLFAIIRPIRTEESFFVLSARLSDRSPWTTSSTELWIRLENGA